MSNITPNQWTILERLEKGPEWIRSFQPAKPLLNKLIDQGLVERCRPHLGRANNMVRLTAAGCAELDIDASDVPAKRERAKPKQKPKAAFGAIKEGITSATRSVCETFVRAIAAGEPQNDVVRELADREGVQRPAIWRRLRTGGVLPEYGRRKANGQGRPAGGGNPGYSARRRQLAIQAAESQRPDLRPELLVDRDPCPRCGARGDFGCGHSQAPLRMVP